MSVAVADAPAVGSTHGSDRLVRHLRHGLLILAAFGVVLTAIELAMLRHWGTFEEVIPWFILAITAGLIVAVATRPSPPVVRVVRWASLGLAAATTYGILEHVSRNHESGALDAVYGPKWDTMSSMSQWWAAATESVGPAPPLAPAALALGAVCLLLATWGLGDHAAESITV